MKIYHTETQADYNALLIELEEQGCFWAYGGKPPTEWRDEFWEFYKESTCVGVRSNKQIQYSGIDYYKEEYPDIPITKYKEGHSVAPEVTYISDLSLGGNEMKKDKSWLLEKHRECIQSPKTGEKMLDEGYELALNDMLVYINQLDEPELTQRQVDKWLDDRDMVAVDTMMVHQTGMQNKMVVEKPVIPQFVADWIEENECLSLIYIGFKLFNNRIKDEDLNDWISNNQEQFCRAFLAWPNVEVEKEKLYRVRAGNRYVRFNLDGSIIGVKKDNSIVCLERLSKLPFDYKKAVESGIITLEEVTQ